MIMRRLVLLLAAAVGFLVSMFSHEVLQAQPQKQLICHVSGNSGAHIIEVSTNAVPKHLENHGDCIINSTDRTLIGQPCDATDANNNDICDIQP
jgi:hypothetical protein